MGSARSEELFEEFAALHAEVLRDIGQDRGERADPERRVGRDGDVVLAALARREANVAAGLSGDAVTEAPECSDKLGAIQITRQAGAHAAITSSRT